MYTNPKFIKTLGANFEGRDFLIGDLHGCYDELLSLLNHVGFCEDSDRVLSVGDLIDRGPKSKESVELLRKPWFHAVLGNHEDLMINQIVANRNGDNKSIQCLDYVNSLDPYLNDMLNMPLIIEVEHLLLGKIYIVHSEFLPEHISSFTDKDIDSEEYLRLLNGMKSFDFSGSIAKFVEKHKNEALPYKLKQKLIWSRKIIQSYVKKSKEKVDAGDLSFLEECVFNQEIKIFSGHNIVPYPMKVGQQYYVDTGAALGYSPGAQGSYFFKKLGHEFFALTLVDITTGTCYACITSEENRGKIVQFGSSLYHDLSKNILI